MKRNITKRKGQATLLSVCIGLGKDVALQAGRLAASQRW